MYKNHLNNYFEKSEYNEKRWHNIHKENIINTNKIILESSVVDEYILNIINYIINISSYFEESYNIFKREWNSFLKNYKTEKAYINTMKKEIKSSSIELYGNKFSYNKYTLDYKKLSPTDKNLKFSIQYLERLKSNDLKEFKKNIKPDNFDIIRGTILHSNPIPVEKFKKEIHLYLKKYEVNTLIEINKNSIGNYKASDELLILLNNQISSFYGNVISFFKEFEGLRHEYKINSGNKKIKIGEFSLPLKWDTLNKYVLIKANEFRELSKIYNILFFTTLNVINENIYQDKECILLFNNLNDEEGDDIVE